MPETTRARLGRKGEDLAVRFLQRTGYRVLARNWQVGRREVDIIALREGTVAFIEVKTRGPGPERPSEALSPRQCRGLRRAAEAWIHANPGVGMEFRFDLIAVEAIEGEPARIEHLPNAFYGEEAL